MELGIYTFGDVGQGITAAERLRNLVEEIEVADRAGIDVFGVGEHHRADYAVSAPAVVLAAGAARSRRIKLSSAVTVLSSDDPVRVYQQFSTLNAISGGRAEIIAGRGSFIESYPLFGYDLNDYDQLFAEKLDLLLAIRASERVSWTGETRPPLKDAGVYPRTDDLLPIWIGVGGTPQSIARAASLGLPMALAIIGGEPARFAPHAKFYRDAAAKFSVDPSNLRLGLNMHGYVAETMQKARDEFFPGYAEVMTRIGRERGWPPVTRAQFEASCSPEGHLIIGSPADVAEKIAALSRIFSMDRLLIQMGLGSLPHRNMLRAIELLGEVRQIVTKEAA
jgi:probable LLM family oxidoreductase